MGGGELPGPLVNEISGVHGILHGHVVFLKKHFYLITMKEFLENRKHMSRKVQAIYLWWQKPVFDQELLQSLPNLKVIVNSGVGMDHLDLTLVASFGVKMANAPRAVSSSTADTGMALLLASARRIVEGYHIAISSDMEYRESDFLGVQVTGATLGIVGMGSIGYKIALRAKAFEMNISYHSRTRRDHALLQLKNVIITPHLGGKTDKATRMISEEAVENILAALKGLLMASEVLPS